MRLPLRPFILLAALVALVGCATKPPPVEPPPIPPSATSSASNPAPDSAPMSPSTGGTGSAQTGEERQAALDRKLNDSLGSFDAQIRKEQQKIAQERDARQTAIATVASQDKTQSNSAGAAGFQGPGERASGSSNKRATVRAERGGDLKSDRSAGANNGVATGNGAVAAETPDGNDDDIVARRLRKAAEQETDPELKDRLWQEYVEYKKNTQVK